MEITEELKGKLEKIKPEKVILYLNATGWRFIDSLPICEVFQIKRGEKIFQADVPVGQISDDALAMCWVIYEIAKYENRSFDEVFATIKGDK
jgi:hypothetical protein